MKILKMFFVLAVFVVSATNVNAQSALLTNHGTEGGCMESRECGFEMCMTSTEETDCFLVEIFVDGPMLATPFIAADNGFYEEFGAGNLRYSATVCFEAEEEETAMISCGLIGYCRDGCIVVVSGD